ncbi:MAG: hypothetical protein ACLU00_10530 [Mediterraneibacter faecis]
MAIPMVELLSSLGRKRGFVMMERTTRSKPDERTDFKISAKRGYRHYFFTACTKRLLEKLKNKLQEYYPEIQIAGMYSPPFPCIIY